ncbi:MAG: hypothetical protein Q8P13_01955 [bacterium]|nr:hypothetical protein [bacterium]
MSEFFTPERYAQEELKPTDAPVKHFTPVEGSSRDRFGNRVFESPKLGYLDRENDEVRAALLVSEEGERFIKSNPGILKDIEEGLLKLEYARDEGSNPVYFDSTDLPKGNHLSRYSQGNQSNVYLLEVKGEKYILKTHRVSAPHYQDARQPYINEMLQTQEMAADLKEDFEKLNMRMPDFLFASGQVSLVRFEEGNIPEDSLLDTERFKQFAAIANRYLSTKEDQDLWKKIWADDLDEVLVHETKKSNFVETEDGSLVWIDPFFYEENDPLEKFLKMLNPPKQSSNDR